MDRLAVKEAASINLWGVPRFTRKVQLNMSKKMLINATHSEENRVAIVEDGVLTELDIETAGSTENKGDIYKATVVRVESGLQAAFVDYGANRLGFLQIGELHPSLFPKKTQESGQRPRITEILKRGQELLVQIIREERGTKGAALTTNLSLPGRYMVLMPDSTTKGISRKVEDDTTRKKLKEAMATLKIPDNMGYIVRTAGIGQKVTELKRDYKYLSGIYKKIQQANKKEKAPALLFQESNVVIRSIREHFSTDMDEILIDDPDVFNEAKDFFKAIMPAQVKILKQHLERRPIFSRYQVEEQIETITSNKVPLPSGGSIVLDQTEALVAIDVNSGRMAGEHGIEATAYKSNMEAAAEIGRQLRLRDLGGLIVIDFIDMRDRKNNREVEKTLKNSLKNDKAKLSVGKISQFGLLEMSRQRLRPTLAEGSYQPCPNCGGSGRVKNAEAQAVAVLRQLHTTCAKGKIGKAIVTVPEEVGHYLLNVRREEILEMEKKLNISIHIIGNHDFHDERVELDIVKLDKDADNTESETPSHPKPDTEPKKSGDQNKNKPESNGGKKDDEKKDQQPRRRRPPRRKPSAAKNEAAQDDAPTEQQEKTPVTIPEAAAEKKDHPPRRRRPPRRRPNKDKPAEENKTDAKKDGNEPEKEKIVEKETPAEEVKSKPKRSFLESFMEPLLPKGNENNK
ncbi:MAG: ribonuclease E [Desulfuromonas sp.]|nr:MAG: ribonuclease E [Desulfuromonas sp.]